MIVVDSSALVAIIFGENERATYEAVLLTEDRRLISAVNAHETATVIRARLGKHVLAEFWRMLVDARVEIVPFDEAQVKAAGEAFDRFGKGIHPRARLNICDCAAYALAKTQDARLLFKGDDFAHTDIVAAV